MPKWVAPIMLMLVALSLIPFAVIARLRTPQSTSPRVHAGPVSPYMGSEPRLLVIKFSGSLGETPTAAALVEESECPVHCVCVGVVGPARGGPRAPSRPRELERAPKPACSSVSPPRRLSANAIQKTLEMLTVAS